MVHLSLPRSAWVYLGVAILLATYPLLFGRFYLVGDMHDVFLPLEDFFHQELLHSRLPAWDPDIAWGFPVIASAQLGFFYPILLILRLLPVPVYLPLVLLLHVLALALGTYQVARREGVSHYGALVAALSMSLGSFVFQHLTHLNIIITLAWLPWQFLAMKRVADAPTLKHQALAAITVGLPFIAGHVHVPFLIALISTVYYLTTARGPFIKRIGVSLLIAFLAATLAAVQLLPTIELVHYSSRGEGGDFALERANQLSWPLYHLPTIIFPRFFGVDSTYWGKRLEVEHGIFIGTLPFLLALAALHRSWQKHRFFVVAAAIGFLLALGDLSPFRLVGFEPSLWYFSAPARWLLLYTFAMSILAGVGFDYMVMYPQKLRRGLTRLLIPLALVVILANVVLWNLPANTPQRLTAYLNQQNALGERPLSYYDEKFASLLISLRENSVSLSSPYTWLPLAVITVLIFMAYHRQLHRIVLGLATLELIVIAATTTPTIPWKTIVTPPASLEMLPSLVTERQARIFSIPPAGDTGLFLTNPATRPTLADRQQNRELLLSASHARFNIAGSTWPASLDLQSHNEALASLTPEELNIGAIITLNQTQKIDIETLSPEPRVALVSSSSVHSLPYPTDHPTRLQWTVDTPEPATLIIRDTWYPGWQAAIDGQPAVIEVYKNVFRALAVPPGLHTIVMRYKPLSLYWGMTISSVTILLLTGLICLPLRQRIRR